MKNKAKRCLKKILDKMPKKARELLLLSRAYLNETAMIGSYHQYVELGEAYTVPCDLVDESGETKRSSYAIASGLYHYSASACDVALLKFKRGNFESVKLVDAKGHNEFKLFIIDELNQNGDSLNQNNEISKIDSTAALERYNALRKNTLDPDLRIDTLATQSPALLPIYITDNTTEISIVCDNYHQTIPPSTLPNLNFFYLRADAMLHLKSTAEIFIGRPLELRQARPTKYRLIMQIFVDSLANIKNLEEYMPHTFRFFNNVYFARNYACGDSTAPSVPTFYNALYPLSSALNEQNPIMRSDAMDGFSDYFTSAHTTSWCICPKWGFMQHLDRHSVIDRGNMDDIITNALENLQAFPERSHFTLIGLFEVHNLLVSLPDISMMSATIEAADFVHQEDGASPFHKFSPLKVREYYNTLAYVDRHLERIYSYINNNYNDDEICITLISDHGKASISPTHRHILNNYRMNVPLFIKAKDFHYEPKMREQITSNVDILPTIAALAGVELPKSIGGKALDGRCIFHSTCREYAVSESIYIDQTYKLRLSFSDFVYFYESKHPVKYAEDFVPIIDLDGKSFLIDNDEKEFHDEEKLARGFTLLKEHLESGKCVIAI